MKFGACSVWAWPRSSITAARGIRTSGRGWAVTWAWRCASDRPGRCGATSRSSPSGTASERGFPPRAAGASQSARGSATRPRAHHRCNNSSIVSVTRLMETETKPPIVSRRRIATAVSIITGVWVLLHVYIGRRLLGPAPLAAGLRVLAWAGILLLALGPIVALWAGRARWAERSPAKPILEAAGFTAMGLSSLLIVFALAGDALHARAWLGAG